MSDQGNKDNKEERANEIIHEDNNDFIDETPWRPSEKLKCIQLPPCVNFIDKCTLEQVDCVERLVDHMHYKSVHGLHVDAYLIMATFPTKYEDKEIGLYYDYASALMVRQVVLLPSGKLKEEAYFVKKVDDVTKTVHEFIEKEFSKLEEDVDNEIVIQHAERVVIPHVNNATYVTCVQSTNDKHKAFWLYTVMRRDKKTEKGEVASTSLAIVFEEVCLAMGEESWVITNEETYWYEIPGVWDVMQVQADEDSLFVDVRCNNERKLVRARHANVHSGRALNMHVYNNLFTDTNENCVVIQCKGNAYACGLDETLRRNSLCRKLSAAIVGVVDVDSNKRMGLLLTDKVKPETCTLRVKIEEVDGETRLRVFIYKGQEQRVKQILVYRFDDLASAVESGDIFLPSCDTVKARPAALQFTSVEDIKRRSGEGHTSEILNAMICYGYHNMSEYMDAVFMQNVSLRGKSDGYVYTDLRPSDPLSFVVHKIEDEEYFQAIKGDDDDDLVMGLVSSSQGEDALTGAHIMDLGMRHGHHSIMVGNSSDLMKTGKLRSSLVFVYDTGDNCTLVTDAEDEDGGKKERDFIVGVYLCYVNLMTQSNKAMRELLKFVDTYFYSNVSQEP